MARLLVLESTQTGEQFRLVMGYLKSDMQLSEQERVQTLANRLTESVTTIDAHMKNKPDDTIVVTSVGHID